MKVGLDETQVEDLLVQIPKKEQLNKVSNSYPHSISCNLLAYSVNMD